MSMEILENYIRQYIESQEVDKVTFVWQGGEPTLAGLDFFKQVVRFQNTYRNGKQIENAFQTNGVLLNDEWSEFFAKHEFLLGISIDGPQKLHDKYRLDRGGKPTFDRVMTGIDFLKKHQVEFNTLSMINRENSVHPLEVYHFLKEAGSGFIQFIPAVEKYRENETSVEVTNWSVEPAQFGEFLCAIFDEWVRNDVGRYFIQMFDVALEAWLGMPSGLCIFSGTCGQALALEHNGDLYSCDHFVYPQNKLGNIMTEPLVSLVFSDLQISFGQNKKILLPEACTNCNVRFACNGGCPKNRILKQPEEKHNLNWLCEGYKKFFSHIAPYMRFMANELRWQQPPANVMQWAAQKDCGFPAFKIGRNDLCPCGSGEKYKKCCGT